MNNLQSTSITIRDEQGSLLYVLNKNKVEFGADVRIVAETYYKVGSSLYISERKRIIRDVQFSYRNRMGDFQAIITVR